MATRKAKRLAPSLPSKEVPWHDAGTIQVATRERGIGFRVSRSRLIGRSRRRCVNEEDQPSKMFTSSISVPPRGVQDCKKSAGKTQGTGRGAAKSAAVDADLALVIDRWSTLKAHAKVTIMGIVRNAKKSE